MSFKIKEITERIFVSSFLVASLSIAVLFLSSSLYAEPVKTAEEVEAQLAKDSNTEINVKNADIDALIRIFSKKTKRNYILDERVKGTVSIYLPGKVSSEEATYILDSVLSLKGFTTVPIGDNLWKIIPAQEAKQTTVPIVDGTEGRGSASVVTRFINLKYVAAEDVKQLLSSLISSYGLISAYTGTNSLILIDSEDNIQRLMKIVDYLDIPSTNSEMTIIPIEHADAVDIATKITEILSGGENETKTSTTSTSIPSVESTRASLRKNSSKSPISSSATTVSVSMRAKDPKIISDERTNSIIIVADEEVTVRIRALVDQLDSPVDLSGNRFYVYSCQHASAEDLAEVLSGLVEGGSGGSSSSSESSLSSSQRRTANQTRTPGQSRTSSSSGTSSPGAFNFGEDISITADPSTNSLVIVSNKTDYLKIKELLSKLDIKRRQVIVEALILEVAMSDTGTLGAEFNTAAGGTDGGLFASNNLGNLGTLFTNPSQLEDFTLAAASAGTLTLPGGISIPSHSAMIRAAQTNSNVNVLSAPTILATDNEDAEIVVGQNVPFISSTASNQTDLNNVFNQIDRQDVGITLRITPQISSSDFVTLKLFTEVSNVLEGTAGSDLGPTTTIRTSDTTVITKDSQMIVIGGLMSNNVTESERGVPFLKDIPLIGGLFRTTTDREEKTNLLIFITPRIVQDQFDARDISLKHKNELQEVIERYEIGPDRYEQLENPDFDNVVDGTLYEGEKPGTIRGKKKPAMDKVALPTLELSVEEKPNEELRQVSPKAEEVQLGRYVILETRSKLPEDTPEFISNESRLVGVYLPPEISSKAKEYFKVGQVYSFLHNESDIKLQATGIFYSEEEAKNFYPDLKQDWYSLTPYEILNLGKGPWVN